MNLHRNMFRASETAQCVRVLAANAGYLSFIARIKFYLSS